MPLSDTLTKHYNALFSCPVHQTVLATAALGITASYLLLRSTAPLPRSIPSPRLLTPNAKTPYPHTLLPGTRLASTPHGTISVAEFGPIHGRKILLVHGITTPSVVFTSLATSLASDGYRVMTFDLFGRGYSDAPLGVDYDERLFITQIFYALYSSPLSWDRFSLVGYSLGGAIGVAFAAHFAERLESLVLFAPAGILPANKLGLAMRLVRGGWVPSGISSWMVGRRVVGNAAAHSSDVLPEDGLDYSKVLAWQASTHAGFAGAYASTFRYGPVFDRQGEWKEVAKKGIERIGIMVGQKDDVISPMLLPEMVALLGGEQKVRGEVLLGVGHGLVRDRWRECADFVADIVGDPEGDEGQDVYNSEVMGASTSSYVVGDF